MTLRFAGMTIGVLVALAAFAQPAEAASRYLVATGNWDSTGSWSATSGGASGASVPVSSDDVFLNAASSTANLTINVASACRSLDATGFTGTLTHNTSITLSVGDGTAGVFKLVSGMTYTLQDTGSPTLNFVSTTTGNNITFGGKSLGAVTFNGSGGAWTLQDALTLAATSSQLTLTAGTLDTNGQALTVGIFHASNSNTRTLTLGASVITCTNSAAISPVWNCLTTTGMTLNANTSNIVLSSTGKQIFSGGGLTYYKLSITGGGAAVSKPIRGSNTFNTILINVAPVTVTFANGTTQTVTNFIALGTAGNLITITSDSAGVAATLSKASGNVACDYLSLKDSTAAGGASWYAGANSTNVSGNSVWSFTDCPQRYLVATGNWSSTSAWSANSGGGAGVPVPAATNNVFLDAGSGSANLTIDAASSCRSLDATGFTGTLTHNSGITLSVGDGTAGLFKLVSGMTYTLGSATTSALSFVSTTTGDNVTTGGKTLGNTTFNGVGGAWTLQDALTLGTGTTLTLTNGTLDTNGQTVSVGLFSSSNANTRTLTLGASGFTCSGTGTVWDFGTVTGLTLNGNTSTITLSDTSGTGKTFAGGGKTFNNLSITGAGTGAVTISGSNTFNTLTIGAPKTVTFTAGTTQTLTTWSAPGTSGNVITINSSSAGSAATLSKASGNACGTYLSIQDSTATGGAGWYAGVNSTNVSGNTGWSFTLCPAGGDGLLIGGD